MNKWFLGDSHVYACDTRMGVLGNALLFCFDMWYRNILGAMPCLILSVYTIVARGCRECLIVRHLQKQLNSFPQRRSRSTTPIWMCICNSWTSVIRPSDVNQSLIQFILVLLHTGPRVIPPIWDCLWDCWVLTACFLWPKEQGKTFVHKLTRWKEHTPRSSNKTIRQDGTSPWCSTREIECTASLEPQANYLWAFFTIG